MKYRRRHLIIKKHAVDLVFPNGFKLGITVLLGFQRVFIFSFSNSLLGWCVHSRGLAKDAMLGYISLEGIRKVFFRIIAVKNPYMC